MHWIDWLIVIIPIAITVVIACKSQRYVKGVSDFLAAGRVAGRYVVAVAGGEAALGLISVIASIEVYYNAGFGYRFWQQITVPLALLLSLTGYCAYRFRETKALTMGQFLEMRYNRAFRVYAAVLQATSGILNYAIFPAVGGRFLIYYLDLPFTIDIFGWQFPTFGLIMAAFLSVALLIIMVGGQVTIMVTDCVQGLLSYPLYMIIVVYIMYKFSWSEEMAPALLNRPAGESFLNPYNVENLRDFNIFFVISGVVGTIINRMSWSGTQGYNAAAANAHEQKIGGLLGTWRMGFSVMMYTLLAIAAYTYLNSAHFAPEAAKVRSALTLRAMDDVAGAPAFAKIRQEVAEEVAKNTVSVKRSEPLSIEQLASGTSTNYVNGDKNYRDAAAVKIASVDPGKVKTFKTIYGQMLAPLAIKEMLPIGITGVFCAIMIFLLVSTDTTYIHSWGSILAQDLVLPLRKKPFTPKQQLNLLRGMMALVAVIAFLFSFFFSQVDYIMMFFVITGAIWMGGSGSCIVFGLYWKRGTTAAAFATMIWSSTLAAAGFISQQLWGKHIYPWLAANDLTMKLDEILRTLSGPFEPYIVWRVKPDTFPLNSKEMYFIIITSSILLYVVTSLLTCRKPFNMDRLLHRGIYNTEGLKEVEKLSLRNLFKKLIGIDANYTAGDKILAWSVFFYSFIYNFILIFIAVIVWNIISPWPEHWWANYFYVTSIIVAGIIGLISSIWFPICGTIDLIKLFKRLETKESNDLDDGRVEGNVSLADAAELAAKENKNANS